MHKILVHASGGLKTTITSMLFCLFPRDVYTNYCFTKETTADHHQVPRMRIKRVPGTIKTETGTGRENGTTGQVGTFPSGIL